MKFLLLIHSNPEALNALSPQQREELIGERQRLIGRVRDLRASGELVSVLSLPDPTAGKSIHAVAGTPVISDRPFLETKELLAGALLVECPTIDRALEIAAEIPSSFAQRIDVRPVREIDDQDLADADIGE